MVLYEDSNDQMHTKVSLTQHYTLFFWFLGRNFMKTHMEDKRQPDYVVKA